MWTMLTIPIKGTLAWTDNEEKKDRQGQVHQTTTNTSAALLQQILYSEIEAGTGVHREVSHLIEMVKVP